MKQEASYQVRCQVTTAELQHGEVVSTRQTEHHLLTNTYEVTEVFSDLYAQFRGPRLLGLQILSICRCQSKQAVAA